MANKLQSFLARFAISALLATLFSAGLMVEPTSPAIAANPCPTGWTLITAAGTYKGYCNQLVTGAASSVTVPNGITTFAFTAGGGQGGAGVSVLDFCCNNQSYGGAGRAGDRVSGTVGVTAGQVFAFYPGGAGGTGVVGTSTYSNIYNGGTGGGGGGAATVVTLDGAIIAVAAGGGGGGSSGYCGVNGVAGGAHTPYGNSSTGGAGTSNIGGGGGGGFRGGAGGGTFYQSWNAYGGNCSGRTGGYGGASGSNWTSGFTQTIIPAGQAGAGAIDVYFAPRPVADVILDAETTIPTRDSWTYSVTWAPDISGFTLDDVAVLENGSVASGWTKTLSGTMPNYKVTIAKTGLADGTQLQLQVDQTGVLSTSMSMAGVGYATSLATSLDTNVPVITLEAPSSPNKATTLAFTLNSDEPLVGLTYADFSVTGTTCAITSTALSGPVGTAPYVYTLNVTSCANPANVVVTLAANAATDSSGNPVPATSTSSSTVVTDRTLPTGSFTTIPSTPNKNTNMTFVMTASETLGAAVTASNFTVSQASCTIGTVSNVDRAYTLPVTCTTTAVSFTITLKAGLVDLAGNVSTATAVTTAVVTDYVLPSVTSITTPTTSPTKATSITYTVTMSEAVTGLAASSFTASGCSISGFNATSTTVYTVTVNNCTDAATQTLTLKSGMASDAAGNLGPTNSFTTNGIVIDYTAPVITKFELVTASPTKSTLIQYRIVFSEPVATFTFNTPYFTWTGSGCTSSSVTTESSTSFLLNWNGCPTQTLTLYAKTNSFTDLAGNIGAAVNTATIPVTVDQVVPVATWGTAPTSPTKTLPTFSLSFNEAVIGLTSEDITNTGTAQNCTFTITPISGNSVFSVTAVGCGSGTIVMQLAANAITDAATNTNVVKAATSITYDNVIPFAATFTTVTASRANVSTIAYTLTMNESVTGMTTGALICNNCTITNFTGSGTTYTINISSLTSGATVSVTLKGNTLTDAVGNVGPTTATTSASVLIDKVAPSLTSFTTTYGATTAATSITYSLVFSEDVTGLATTDFVVTNCTGKSVTGGATNWSLTLTTCSAGSVSVSLSANTVSDLAAITGPTAASSAILLTIDRTAPTLSFTGAAPAALGNTNPTYIIQSNEPLVGFTSADVTNAGSATGCVFTVNASGTSGANYLYTVVATNCSDGTVKPSITALSITDAAGNPAPATNLVYATAVGFDSTKPTLTNFSTTFGASTTQGTLNYSLGFSEPVTGLIATDFAIVGTNCAVAVSGSGATWGVTVTNCSPNQTITLKLNANSIIDAANNLGPIVDSNTITIAIDRIAPSASWGATPTAPTAFQPTLTLNFTEPVSGFTGTDIRNAGTATGCTFTVSNIAANQTFSVTSVGCSDGTVIAQLASESVADAAGNLGPASAINSGVVTIDSTLMTVVFQFSPPAVTYDSLTYRLKASQPIDVNSLSNSDFSNTGTAQGCLIQITPITATNDTEFDVTISQCGDGTVALGMNANAITDAGHLVSGPQEAVTATAVTVDSTLLRISATVSAITTSPSNDSMLKFAIDFNQDVFGLTGDATDFSLVGGTGCVFDSLIGSGSHYELRVSGCSNGAALAPRLSALSVADVYGNLGPAQNVSGDSVSVDTQSATPTFSAASVNNTTGVVSYTITFDEPVFGLTNSDFTNVGTATISGFTVTRISDTQYTVSTTAASSGSVILSLTGAVTDSAGNTTPASGNASFTSASASVNLPALTGAISTNSNSLTNRSPNYRVTFNRPIATLNSGHFNISGVTGCTKTLVAIDDKTFDLQLTNCSDGNISVALPSNVVADTDAQSNATMTTGAIAIDTTAPSVNISLRSGSNFNTSHVYDVVFTEAVTGVTTADFAMPIGMTAGCVVGAVSGSGTTYVVTLSGCSPGTYALEALVYGVTDLAGNSGPVIGYNTATAVQSAATIQSRPISGTAPTALTKISPSKIFGSISASTGAELLQAKVVEAVATAPAVQVVADLSSLAATDPITITSHETVNAGDQFSVKIQTNASSALDSLGFLKIGSTWKYLGRQAFSGAFVTSTPVAFGDAGTYVMKVVLVDSTNPIDFTNAFMKKPKKSTQKSTLLLPLQNRDQIFFSKAVITDADLNFGIQEVIVNISVVAPSTGLPTLVDPVVIQPSDPVSQPAPTKTATPTPTPTPTVTASPTASATPKPSASIAPKPSASATPVASATATPAPSASASATPTPSAAPSASATAAPTSAPAAAAPQPTSMPAPAAVVADLVTISLPVIEPGAPVANPAIGATGDDAAPPVAFDPLASPEGVVAVTQTATQAVALVSSVAAAAGAAAAAAAGAAAAGAAAGAAGAAGGAAAGGASAGSSSAGSSSGGSASSNNAQGSDTDLGGVDVVNESLILGREGWGDRLWLFAIPWITFLDRRSHNAALRVSRFSPLIAKLINDGAYVRAIFGSLTLAAPIAAAVLGAISVGANNGEFLTPPWMLLLAIAVLGVLDASAGFVGAIVFIVGSIFAAGHIPSISESRLLMAVIIASIGPALLTTAFRTIRKHPALNFGSWWERIADFAIAPFMAGWSASAMISTMPALAGLTLPVANHVNDFALFIAAAAFVRVAIEEVSARFFPARLNRINPDHIAEPSRLQQAIVLCIKYAIWVFVSMALIGPSWQIWVGSALFLLPSVIGWFSDKFANVPWLWRVLPSGIPGLALSLVIATLTTTIVGGYLGASPELAQWSFAIMPLPLLLLSIAGNFGRHGATTDEEKPAARNPWIYRIGGVVMLILTLKLAGVI